MFIGQMLKDTEDGLWGQFEGKVTKVQRVGEGLWMELSVGLSHLQVEVTDKSRCSRVSCR